MTKPLSDRGNRLQHAETGSRDLQAVARGGFSSQHTNTSMLSFETVACLPMSTIFK